jgi:hypothetical protein
MVLSKKENVSEKKQSALINFKLSFLRAFIAQQTRRMTVTMKEEGEVIAPELKRLRVMINNFCRIENGSLLPVIDLRRYGMDSGQIITNGVVQELCGLHTRIENLNLQGCSQVSDVGLWAIARHLLKLQVLNCSGLQQITTVGIRSLSLRCTDLRELDLSCCMLIDDISLTVLAGGTWKLHKLSLRGCSKITDNGVGRISQGLGPTLLSLNLDGCPNIGEFGDRGLKEIGNHCHLLKELSILTAKRIEDTGLIALANGCPLLEVLTLAGLEMVSVKSLTECAKSFSCMKKLTLIDNRKIFDKDYKSLMGTPMMNSVTHLELRYFQELTDNGISSLVQTLNPSMIYSLSFPECHHLTDVTAVIIGHFCPALRCLDLTDCGKITDNTLHSLAQSLRYLVSLKLDGNKGITTHTLIKYLELSFEFVEMSNSYLGYSPKPQVEKLIQLKKESVLFNYNATKIQSMVRRKFADRIYWERYREKLIDRAIPLFQAVIRGRIQRKKYSFIKYQMFRIENIIKIQSKYRSYCAYQVRIRYLKERNYRLYCNRLANIIQKLFRGMKGRKKVKKVRANKANIKLEEARKRAINEINSIKIQRIFRGYCGRMSAYRKYYEREQYRIGKALEERKARFIQRIVYGFLGRRKAYHRRMEIALYQKKWNSARNIQRVFRGHRGRVHTHYLRKMAELERQHEAALSVQRSYRGYRGRLLFAVAAALRILRQKHQFYAVEIQRFLRGCMGRYYFRLHKDIATFRKRQFNAAIVIQRVYRGHKGREASEIEKELQAMEHKAKPLIKHLQSLEEQANAMRKLISRLESMEKMLHSNLFDIERELGHCNLTTNKYTDSSRINGVPQRFLTKFLKVRLKDHLDHEVVSCITFNIRYFSKIIFLLFRRKFIK